MIENTACNLGKITYGASPKDTYKAERNSTSTSTAKAGLIYPSDY